MILGIGTDLSDVKRLSGAIARRGERLVRRVFTPGEIAYCKAARRPAVHFAARFAAKEAVFKALGTGWGKGVRWRDVEVRVEESGRPRIHLKGEAKRRADSLGAGRVWVSLSTERDQAMAVVILESVAGP